MPDNWSPSNEQAVVFSELDRRALYEAERAGITAPRMISSSQIGTLESLSFDLEVMEARLRVAEQRIEWLLEQFERSNGGEASAIFPKVLPPADLDLVGMSDAEAADRLRHPERYRS